MKNNTQDVASILVTAEKFFTKGNYLQAKKQFELAEKIGGLKDLEKKILLCDQELQNGRVKDLLKRARKHIQKKHPQKALQCFNEAYQITGEDWLQEKINELQEGVTNQNAYASAQSAEASGEYLQAATQYEKAFAIHSEQAILSRKACCLVKAENYEQAITAFQQLDTLDCEASYNFGFSLAKTGNYYECLRNWEHLESQDVSFLSQKNNTQALLLDNLYDRLEQNTDATETYKIAIYLQESSTNHNLDNLVDYCKYTLVEELWENKKYAEIKILLNNAPPETNNLTINLYAKTSFKLAELNGDISGLCLYWLSAIFNLKLDQSIPQEEEIKIRQKLLCMAEELINKSVNTEKERSIWNLEKSLLNNLHSLFVDQKSFTDLLCTPRIAKQLNKSDQILDFIQEHQTDFNDKESSLRTGSYYSLAMPSLYLMEQQAYEEAIDCLPQVTERNKFEEYGRHKVNFAYGKHCLDNGKEWPKRLINAAIAWFEISPSQEQEFTNRSFTPSDADILFHYEEFLIALHKKHPSISISKFLSMVISTRAAILVNNEKSVSNKVMQVMFKKALQLDPDNALAIKGAELFEIKLEIQKMDDLFDRHKINKACTMARQTKHQEVKNNFFQWIEAIVNGTHWYDTNTQRIFFLKECYDWTVSLDPDHFLVDEIHELLQDLEE